MVSRPPSEAAVSVPGVNLWPEIREGCPGTGLGVPPADSPRTWANISPRRRSVNSEMRSPGCGCRLPAVRPGTRTRVRETGGAPRCAGAGAAAGK